MLWRVSGFFPVFFSNFFLKTAPFLALFFFFITAEFTQCTRQLPGRLWSFAVSEYMTVLPSLDHNGVIVSSATNLASSLCRYDYTGNPIGQAQATVNNPDYFGKLTTDGSFYYLVTRTGKLPSVSKFDTSLGLIDTKVLTFNSNYDYYLARLLKLSTDSVSSTPSKPSLF
jgi:hypothetical protein